MGSYQMGSNMKERLQDRMQNQTCGKNAESDTLRRKACKNKTYSVGTNKGRTRQGLALGLPDMQNKLQLSVLPKAREGHFVVLMRKRDLLRVFGHGRGFRPAQSAELLV